MNLIFDVSNIYHRSYSIVSEYNEFNIEEDKWLNILLRKFFIDINSIINHFDNNLLDNVFFAFDSNSWRKKYLNEYKANRKSKHDNFYKILEKCYNILIKKGFNAIKIDQLEADDIIMLINDYESKLGKDNIIISNDKDLLQLVSNKSFVFTSNSLNYKCYAKSIRDLSKYNFLINIFKEIDTEFLLFSKILLGDDSDNIKRIIKRGIGNKKIKDLYIEYKSLNYNLFDFLQFKNLFVEKIKIDLQVKLIWLNKNFFPKEAVDEFENLSVKNLVTKNFNLETFLTNLKD